jgi:DNA-directed RNA polymerase II subunit RPB1
MGFDPLKNRPESFIIKNFPIPPVAIRPSVRLEMLSSGPSEDGLTSKLADIVKDNGRLKKQKDKSLVTGEDSKYNQDYQQLLQYDIATYYDNDSVLPKSEQKGSKASKSVSERLKGKTGRIRGNLMGKRVDFSARTVITSDPNLSLDELGVPIKIAMNVTFPEVVTEFNIDKLSKLVRNGRDVYPGANFILPLHSLELGKKSKIDLRYRKRSVKLHNGDIVERHIIDNDPVLFNRQPSLHKMSMMCHKVVIMPYQTFRLNVLDTPPYNADFDGDEMNLHCPQNIQTMSELMDIAAVPYMILAPRDGKPIIEVVQDTLVGSYRLTKDYTRIQDKTLANIQMVNSYFKGKLDKPDDNYMYSGKEAYSQILPPNLFINLKNKKEEQFIVNNSVLAANSGSLDKKIFHDISTGLIPVIYHDYGPFEVRKFLDNTQRLICRWLLTSGFSVGISDLVPDKKTEETLKNKIKEMKEYAMLKLSLQFIQWLWQGYTKE